MCKAAVFVVLLLCAAHAAYAEPSVCKAKYSNHKSSLLQTLRQMETDYRMFRWTEFKIRRQMYERLWQSRVDGNDPLSKEKRAQGQEEEKRLREALQVLSAESTKASNGFVSGLGALEQADMAAPEICERTDFRACLAVEYKPFYLLARQAREAFNHIFEQEKEYRKDAEGASGGKEEAYLYSALESPSEHTDFFWRFESPRSALRFEEDAKISDLIIEMQTMLETGSVGESCCLQCA